MKSTNFVLAALLTVSVSSAAFAQNTRQSNRQNTNVNTQVGVFPLPSGVNRMIALEHNNSVLTESREDDGSKRYAAFQLKHINPRVMAYLFGAETISTEQLVMPPSMNGGFGNNGNNNGGQNFGFAGGNNGFNGGNGFVFPQNNAFGNGANNGFGNQQFGNNGNFGNFPQNTPFPSNQAGLGIGTPVGNFFVPAQTTN